MHVRDGNEEIAAEIPAVVEVIAKVTRWVHPETFRRLPVWCPYTARGRPIYDKTWTRRYTNTSGLTGHTSTKVEANVSASKALIRALGVEHPQPKNWTVCHIWGYDDPLFAQQGSIVRDPRFYSCVGNMVWLPTPLKGFTDALAEIKTMLRTCAYYLFDWICEHPTVQDAAQKIRSGDMPIGYPASWPSPANRSILPPGTAAFGPEIEAEIQRRKRKIRALLEDDTLLEFPRDEVRRVLNFWKIEV